MEEQIVTIKVVTTGEICEMSNDEIIGQIIVQIRAVFLYILCCFIVTKRSFHIHKTA